MAADLKAKVEALRKLPLFTESVALRILEDHDKGRHKNPNFWCRPCIAQMSQSPPLPKPASLYPDRVEVLCPRCRAIHWKPGRCFADDEGFRRVIGIPVGAHGRMKTVTEVLNSPGPTPEDEAKRERIIRERTESLARDAERDDGRP